jgi:hypothetical protein
VINHVERASLVENPFDLPELTHVAASVGGLIKVGAHAEADLIALVAKVAADHSVATAPQLGRQSSTYRTERAGYENSRHWGDTSLLDSGFGAITSGQFGSCHVANKLHEDMVTKAKIGVCANAVCKTPPPRNGEDEPAHSSGLQCVTMAEAPEE